MRESDLTEPFTAFTQYPPVVHSVGAIGALLGGVNVSAPVLAAALVLAAPWYVVHWDELRATSDWARGPNTAGAIWSAENLSWYAWNGLNRQLLLPLSVVAGLGALVSSIRFLKTRDRNDLLLPAAHRLRGVAGHGLDGSRGAVPPTHRDGRAVRHRGRELRGRRDLDRDAGPGRAAGRQVAARSGRVSPCDAAVAGGVARHAPARRERRPTELMRRLRARGIQVIEFDPGTDITYFNPTGLTAFARIAGLTRPPAYDPAALRAPREAFMGRQFITPDLPPPCVDLGEGSGAFVTLGSPFEERRICPPPGDDEAVR